MPARSAFIAGLALAAAMLLAACSSDNGSTAAASSTAAQSTTSESSAPDPCASTAGGAGTAVAVTERGTGSPLMELDTTSVKQGATTFTVTKRGPGPHEHVVQRTDLAPDNLPLTDDGTQVNEKAPDLTLIGKTPFMNVGCATSITLDLPKGDYVLICNLPGLPGAPGHYQFGMVAPPFTVT